MTRDRGSALYLVVTLVATLGFLSIAMSEAFTVLLRETVRERASQAALYAAEGGLAHARAALARDPEYAGDAVEVGAGRAEIRVESGGADGRRIRVRGVVSGTDSPGATVERRIVATVRLGRGLPGVVGWSEE